MGWASSASIRCSISIAWAPLVVARSAADRRRSCSGSLGTRMLPGGVVLLGFFAKSCLVFHLSPAALAAIGFMKAPPTSDRGCFCPNWY